MQLLQITQQFAFNSGVSALSLTGVGDKSSLLTPTECLGFVQGRAFTSVDGIRWEANDVTDPKLLEFIGVLTVVPI